MQLNQKSRGNNGYQNFLFPLSYMDISQGELGSFSHAGSLAMDFIGYGSNGRIYNCPYYAPFDCECVAIWGSVSPMVVWQSKEKVNFIDGTLDYACIGFVHDDNVLSFNVGDERTQGEVIGHTGTYGNVTGDHVHIEVAKGEYAGYFLNSDNVYMLRNAYHLYNAMGVNDTTLVSGHTGGYNWRYFSDIPTPTPSKKVGNFPWVLYANKLRNKYFNT